MTISTMPSVPEFLNWQDVDKLIDYLLPQLRGPYDALMMVTRGGIVPGGLIAEALDITYILTAAVQFPEAGQGRMAWPTFLQFPEDRLLRDKRILIMDDEEVVRESISAMLEHHGYDTVLAAEGEEALRCFDEGVKSGNPFAAVLLDLTIPGGMGGKETIVEIRKRDPHIPVFVASGYANDPIVSRPQEYGFTDSIAKPFTRKALIEILCKHL